MALTITPSAPDLMAITRRTLLQRAAVVGLVPASSYLVGCSDDDPKDSNPSADAGMDAMGDVPPDTTDSGPDLPDLDDYTYDGPLGPENLFQHGVASGDPLTTAVIIWSHVSPEDDSPTEVWWEMSLDPAFEQRVQVGTYQTDGDVDFTVKVDVEELAPGTTYYYRFAALGRWSPVGRTRTAPEGDVSRMRFGMMSCSSYAHGYYHAYRRLAERTDLDCCLHLGDYIYEYGDGQYGSVRTYDPPYEIVSLDDYRRRYRHHRKDLDLQAVHQQHPFICVWDDHETADDSWSGGAENHQPETEGAWEDRKAAGIQAYHEWMPIRSDIDDEGRIFRKFQFGDLIDLIMLDTRLWGRDEPGGQFDTDIHNDPERTLLGDDQEDWLAEQLTTGTGQWKILGQQVMIAQWRGAGTPDQPGPIFNPDQWDGYSPSRDRLFEVIEQNAIDNVVVLTGDIHTSWANDLAKDPYDPEAYDPESGEGAIAVEFVTPGITSPGLGSLGEIVGPGLRNLNPHVKFVDLERRGYIVLDITPERCQAEWYHMENVEVQETDELFVAALATYDGENRLTDVGEPSTPPSDAPDPAP